VIKSTHKAEEMNIPTTTIETKSEFKLPKEKE
jgi:hypothetical protein